MLLLLVASSPALPLRNMLASRVSLSRAYVPEQLPTQGEIRTWDVRGADTRQKMRQPVAGCAGNVQQPLVPPAGPEQVPVQGGSRTWSVHDADARKGLRPPPGPGGVSASGTAPLVPPAVPEQLPVQGSSRTWSVNDADARQGLRAAPGPAGAGAKPLKPIIPAATPEHLPTQGAMRTWDMRGTAAREQVRASAGPGPVAVAVASTTQYTGGVTKTNSARQGGRATPRPAGSPKPLKPCIPAATPEHLPTQGAIRSWTVRGAGARQQLRQ
eukprot:1075769-Prymnesium_polylepis.1